MAEPECDRTKKRWWQGRYKVRGYPKHLPPKDSLKLSELMNVCDQLNEWEQDFVTNAAVMREAKRKFTGRQLRVIRRTWRRIFEPNTDPFDRWEDGEPH